MSRPHLPYCAALIAALLAACTQVNVHGDPKAWAQSQNDTASAADARLRVATYNTSLYDDADGGLIRRLQAGDGNARKIAAVLQRVRPDLVLLNEFDYDAQQRAADLFQHDYLEVAQPGGGEALRYPYRYLAPVNTGVPSGLDLDGDGQSGDAQRADRARGNDAWGYGLHPGQYGMLVLSRYPIDVDAVRSFQKFKWSALPGARQPRDPKTGKPWYTAKVWPQMRLSSKSHWDVPVRTPLGVLHFLAAHPTPPVFDGPEDRNGARNHDEIALWARYLDGGTPSWLCDDQGRCGGLAGDARFVIVGDMNADPVDGDGVPGSIKQLLDHPRVDSSHVPNSEGAAQRATFYGFPRKGNIHEHTGDFGPKAGTLRLDYVLPSRGWTVRETGVFWPRSDSEEAKISEASDHHLVWMDLTN
ncbi:MULTISPECIES: endonuclease/exonuclease/phosphatase family protein [unclassified Lysobacter]|uniref:endonuclease/exonuclease/phosphatase family protein n=1 Tax=unclassified Lysobacter TaxID=2635362 RepID=UPI00203560BC|nr:MULTISPECIES: endonuclease/exonuclease/phosphatase family protein [unclassified Lysobacter]